MRKQQLHQGDGHGEKTGRKIGGSGVEQDCSLVYLLALPRSVPKWRLVFSKTANRHQESNRFYLSTWVRTWVVKG